MVSPVDLTAKAHFLGYSNSALFELGLKYVTSLADYGILVESALKGSEKSIDETVKMLVDYTLCENEKYADERKLEEERSTRELIEATEAFTAKLIEQTISVKREIRDEDYVKIQQLKFLIDQDPSGKASWNDLHEFMTHHDDGRRRIMGMDKPRKDEEITEFIQKMMSENAEETLKPDFLI